MVVAGLTGGIATGKSAVASLFASYGADIIDADIIAREAVRKGTEAWQRIHEHFGSEVLMPSGEINREVLGSIIFGNKEEIKMLNSIVHPAVFREISSRIESHRSESEREVLICDVPLLIETGMYRDFEEVILVYVPEEVQLERLMRRDGISREEALRKVHSQMPIEEKKKYATLLIDNSQTLESTAKEVHAAYRHLKDKALRQAGK